MYHSLAYTLAIGAVANTDVPALSDDIVQIQNNHFILSQKLRLFGAIVYSPTIINAQIVSPTLRQLNPAYIRGLNASAIAVNNPNFFFAYAGGLTLFPFEETQILATAAPGTTERLTAVLFAGDQQSPVPIGNIFPVQFTSAVAAVANAWTTVAYGLTTVIPSGVYLLCGSEVISTNAIAHRWIISNQYWRPGYPSLVSAAHRLPDQLQVDWMGPMGQFKSNDLPRLQVLCNAADAVHTGYMYVQRIGDL